MHGTDRVLDAMHEIKWHVDGSLSFRRSCAHGVCGSDAMRINGRNRLACKTLLKDLDIDKPITVEPIKGLPVEKDLIVDMEPFFDSYREVMPFLVANGSGAAARSACSPPRSASASTTPPSASSAPRARRRAPCSGPTGSTSARPRSSTRTASSSTRAMMPVSMRLEILNSKEGVWRCRTTFNCTEACPRGIQVTKAIAEVKQAVIRGRV